MYNHDRFERRVRAGVRLTIALTILRVVLVATAVVYFVTNPEVIGQFFGAIIAAFQETV